MNGVDRDFSWRGLEAFDTLIVIHGFRYEDLFRLYRRMADRRFPDRVINEFYYRLLMDARKNAVYLERETDPVQELSQYYGEELSRTVVSDIFHNLRCYERRKKQRAHLKYTA